MIYPPLLSTLFPYTTLFRSHKLKMLGFSIKSVMEKELLSQSISKVQHSKESIMETLEYAFDCGLLNKAERHLDRKSTRLNSSHVAISYAVFCLKKKKKKDK